MAEGSRQITSVWDADWCIAAPDVLGVAAERVEAALLERWRGGALLLEAEQPPKRGMPRLVERRADVLLQVPASVLAREPEAWLSSMRALVSGREISGCVVQDDRLSERDVVSKLVGTLPWSVRTLGVGSVDRYPLTPERVILESGTYEVDRAAQKIHEARELMKRNRVDAPLWLVTTASRSERRLSTPARNDALIQEAQNALSLTAALLAEREVERALVTVTPAILRGVLDLGDGIKTSSLDRVSVPVPPAPAQKTPEDEVARPEQRAPTNPEEEVAPEELAQQGEAPVVAATQSTDAPRPSQPSRPKKPSALSNDRPTGEDRLGYERYAEALASILSNPDTNPPLTIALYGAWGVGKSFFFSLLKKHIHRGSPVGGEGQSFWGRAWRGRSDLEQRHGRVDFHTVEFNAWVYSGTENLWAGLVTRLYDDIESYVGPWRSRWFRLRRSWKRRIGGPLLTILAYGALSTLFWWLLGFESLATYLGRPAADGRDSVSDLTVAWNTVKGGGIITGIVVAIVTLPRFLGAVRDLFGALVTTRAAELAALASRRDFRDRIGFMADVKSEIREINDLLNEVQRPDGSRAGGTRPLRVVVFIDDLDRCPPAKAVEVLEAIMLLLADDDAAHFVVVLGLDARVVVRAIEGKYGDVLQRAGVSGYEYLDKLVQVPFGIPAAGEQLHRYLDSLLSWGGQPPKPPEDALASPASADRAPDAPRKPDPSEAPAEAPPGGAGAAERSEEARPPSTPSAAPRAAAARSDAEATAAAQPAEAPFTPEEHAAFRACRAFLPPNPRRLKRMVNVYRLARMLQPTGGAMTEARLVGWILFTERWPVRASLFTWGLDRACVVGATTVAEVFAKLAPVLATPEVESLLRLDADGAVFDRFLARTPIPLGVAAELASCTFNVNPAIRQDVERAVATWPLADVDVEVA